MSSLCHSLNFLEEECNSETFRDRAKYFLVDNERGESIEISLGAGRFRSQPSGKEGHFLTSIELTQAAVSSLRERATSEWLSFQAKGSHGSTVFEGEVLPLSSEGIAVLSDVDDTIKVSGVTKISELLRNTFIRPFVAVPEMLPLFHEWEKQGASFHYVTAAPWQLYPTLAESLRKARFPKGSFHMKEFRWKDSRLFDLFLAQEKYKTPILESFLQALPRKRFILVGDSGEKDPEIFGDLLRRFPERDISLVIRELPERPLTEERLASAIGEAGRKRLRIVNRPAAVH